jgi:DNA primase
MSVTEEIKARLDVIGLISQYVPALQKAGRIYKAPCPFHNEKTPSFVVYPDSGIWKCFGACAEGGDIFKFVMKHENVDFRTALHMLADKAGVTLENTYKPKDNAKEQRLEKLHGLVNETANYFHERLLSARDADQARAYAYKRGLRPETITQFKIGYAPEGWQNAIAHLTKLGYTEAEILDAGVATHKEEGDRVYDRFRNRLMIPIWDSKGVLIGFGARQLNPEDNPKYLNSPQTELFDKSGNLYGLNFARRQIRETETAVIVEGYLDVIQAHQAGFSNVVAPMGTALTEPQLRLLSRFANRLILALDPDAAGMKATMRGLEVARKVLGDASYVFDPKAMMRQGGKLGIDILVMTLPDAQDPDDLIRDTPERWQEMVDSAQPVADYVIAMGTADISAKTPMTEREQVARELLPILLATENDLQQNYHIQRLALKLHLDERTLIQWTQRNAIGTKPVKVAEIAKAPPKTAVLNKAPEAPVLEVAPTNVIEQTCLAALIKSDRLYYDVNRRLRELVRELGCATEALGPLSAKDFSRLDYQMICDTFIAGLAQVEAEPITYLHSNLPEELHPEVEKLLVEPLDAFAETLYPSMRSELRALRKHYVNEEEDGIFVRRLLDLRKVRLKRENQELGYLQQDSDLETALAYGGQIADNVRAISIIDQAVRQQLAQ